MWTLAQWVGGCSLKLVFLVICMWVIWCSSSLQVYCQACQGDCASWLAVFVFVFVCLFLFFFFFFCGFIYLSGFLFISVTSICASYLFLVADSCIHCCLLSCCTCKYGRMSRREGVYQQDVPPKWFLLSCLANFLLQAMWSLILYILCTVYFILGSCGARFWHPDLKMAHNLLPRPWLSLKIFVLVPSPGLTWSYSTQTGLDQNILLSTQNYPFWNNNKPVKMTWNESIRSYNMLLYLISLGMLGMVSI